jgi:aerobic-type carbon monoxide dehydrogenase small subunit (CoxS/CutS family)
MEKCCACTVLRDGEPVLSCLILEVENDDAGLNAGLLKEVKIKEQTKFHMIQFGNKVWFGNVGWLFKKLL